MFNRFKNPTSEIKDTFLRIEQNSATIEYPEKFVLFCFFKFSQNQQKKIFLLQQDQGNFSLKKIFFF